MARSIVISLSAALLALGTPSATSGSGRATQAVAAAQRPETSDLRVQASSVQSLGSGYLQVDGVMSGNVSRGDGSEGQYRVPVTIVYPEDPARCGGEALVDVINSVFYETFAFAGPNRIRSSPRSYLGPGFSWGQLPAESRLRLRPCAVEADSIVAVAEQKALDYPGCVPGVG